MSSIFGKKRQDEVEAARQMAIKLTLSKEVASSIKKLQRDHISSDSAIRSGDTANRFCNVMEAILLHELKDSYSSKTFWPFLIKFTHRDVLEQIKDLAFIKTEVGYCRAWVRLALNDCLMESYMNAILRDTKAIRQHYSRNSFLRDPEQPHIITNYLQGLGNFSFQLSYNSDLLNVWGAAPLMLKGSWAPPSDAKNNEHTSPRSSIDSAMSQDWATSGVTTSRNSSFTIPEGALHVTPSNSMDRPYEVSSFHESELSTNLLRSLSEEEGERGTREAHVEGGLETRKPGGGVDSVVIVEESNEFEDSLVIHLSPAGTSPQQTELSAEPRMEVRQDLLKGGGPVPRTSSPYETTESPESRMSHAKNSHEVQSKLVNAPMAVQGNSQIAGRQDEDYDEELNPFSQDDTGDDTAVPAPPSNQKSSRIPSLQEEIDAVDPGAFHTSDGFGLADDRSDSSDDDNDDDEVVVVENAEQLAKNEDKARNGGRINDHSGTTNEPEDVREEEFTSSYGNSLGALRGWSSEFPTNGSSPGVVTGDTTDGYQKQESYHSVLRNYMDASDRSNAPMANFSTLASASSENPSENRTSEPPMKSPISLSPPAADFPLDFEIIPFSSSPASKHADVRTQELLAKVTTIANEKGLDTQNYQCKGCTRPVGIIYGKAKVCSYDGCYYCYECHVDEEAIIPARVLYSWDFRKHKVAKHTKSFLQQIEAMPLIDIAEANPSLYKAVTELEEVKMVRMQLKYLKAYLFTCKQSVAEELKKRVWPREYMLDHVHLYSMLDFSQVQAGTLAPILRKVVIFAVKHVQHCALCSQKGFICEICENSKIIYPFDMDLTFQCERCKSVYHKACKTEHQPCPRCVRRKLRKAQSNQSSPQENFVSPFT
ncbi:pleckstrin homology domain-containing family M member 1-like [Diadema setosum]|uniref:pleckstrin homology domain-containing family M member 1-like n=1 Tax=Diadema setosum TaxID=31175 RepID=UPI003B3BD731